jgi:hypothetical protein
MQPEKLRKRLPANWREYNLKQQKQYELEMRNCSESWTTLLSKRLAQRREG